MGKTVVIARSLWPVLGKAAPLLAAAGYRVEEAPGWERLLEGRLRCGELSGILLGEHGSPAQEMEVLRRFRQRPGAQGVPVIVVGGLGAVLRAERFRASGADVVLRADISPEGLLERARPLLHYGSLYQSLSDAHRELRERSLVDELTGLPNRRQFERDLARSVEMARRIGHPVSCIIMDIDGLQEINERHGRAAGDRLIREVGELVAGRKRRYDAAARLGGDEFALLLADVGRPGALQAAARLRSLVLERTFLDDFAPVRVTATFGVSTLSPGEEIRGELLVENADRALYWGKESGRNVVRFYPEDRGGNHGAADPDIS